MNSQELVVLSTYCSLKEGLSMFMLLNWPKNGKGYSQSNIVEFALCNLVFKTVSRCPFVTVKLALLLYVLPVSTWQSP